MQMPLLTTAIVVVGTVCLILHEFAPDVIFTDGRGRYRTWYLAAVTVFLVGVMMIVASVAKPMRSRSSRGASP